LPEHWVESVILRIRKKSDSDYRGILLLSTTYNILSNILL